MKQFIKEESVEWRALVAAFSAFPVIEVNVKLTTDAWLSEFKAQFI